MRRRDIRKHLDKTFKILPKSHFKQQTLETFWRRVLTNAHQPKIFQFNSAQFDYDSSNEYTYHERHFVKLSSRCGEHVLHT